MPFIELNSFESIISDEVDLPVDQVDQVAPETQQDLEDPGDKIGQGVSSQNAFMMKPSDCRTINTNKK